MTGSWTAEFFGATYLAADTELHDPGLTRSMVRCALAALDLRPGDRVLDLACGTGRHSVLLAEAGCRVTGVDVVPAYLDQARERARRAGTPVTFVEADMRDLAPLGAVRFDAAVSLHTSLGFYDEATDRAVLGQVRDRLDPGGRVCVDVLNRDWFLHQPGREEPGAYVVTDGTDPDHHHEERFDPVTSRLRWTITGPSTTVAADYRIYSPHEVLALLRAAGLTPGPVYGDYDRGPLHTHSPHVVATGRVDP